MTDVHARKDFTFQEILDAFRNPDPYLKETAAKLVSLMEKCIQTNPTIPINTLWPFWTSQGFAAKAKDIIDPFLKGRKK